MRACFKVHGKELEFEDMGEERIWNLMKGIYLRGKILALISLVGRMKADVSILWICSKKLKGIST